MVANRLKGVGQIGRPALSSLLQAGVIGFFDWGFQDAGGYMNVEIPQSGAYGGNQHILRPVQSQYHSDGTVWEGFRSNWVWQSGIQQAVQPIQISGVFVDSAFIPLGTGVSIDYDRGRAVFPNPIATTSTVKCAYSHKWVNVLDAGDIDAFKRVQTRSMRVDSPHYLQAGSGDWHQAGQTRLQLPAVAVETVNRRTYRPYALGGYQYADTDIIFHVLAEDDQTAKMLADQISYQNEKTIWLFDLKRLADDDAMPINFDGTKNPNALSYTDLVKASGDGGYRWNKCRFYKTEIQGGDWVSESLYSSRVRLTTEVVMTNI